MSQNFYDKLDEYYRLKAAYVAEQNEITKKGKQPTVVDKRKGVSQPPLAAATTTKRPKCVGCRRPVGTIFTTTYDDKTDERLLGATCGDTTDPCALKISLSMGDIRPLPEFIEEEEGRLKDARMQVIKLKNQLLIGTVTEDAVIAAFEELQEEINTSNQLLEYYLAMYDERANGRYNNRKRLEAVAAEKFGLKEEMRRAMAIFTKTRNPAFAQEAVEIYVNQMRPLVATDLEEKYAQCEVVAESLGGGSGAANKGRYADADDSDDEGGGDTANAASGSKTMYRLYQETVTPARLEYTLLEPRVLSFNLGASLVKDKAKEKSRGRGRERERERFVPTGMSISDIADEEI